MARNWQVIHQTGEPFEPQTLANLSGLETDIATMLAFRTGGLVFTFSRSGTLTVTAGTGRFYVPRVATILGVVAAVGTAPTGASILCDVQKNGVTVFTTQANRPAIAAGQTKVAASAVPDITALATGDLLSVNIDQVGSGTAGADLTVEIIFQ